MKKTFVGLAIYLPEFIANRISSDAWEKWLNFRAWKCKKLHESAWVYDDFAMVDFCETCMLSHNGKKYLAEYEEDIRNLQYGLD